MHEASTNETPKSNYNEVNIKKLTLRKRQRGGLEWISTLKKVGPKS